MTWAKGKYYLILLMLGYDTGYENPGIQIEVQILGSKRSFFEILRLDFFWFYIHSRMIELRPEFALCFPLAPFIHTPVCYHMVWTLCIWNFFSVSSLSEPLANSDERRPISQPLPYLTDWWGLWWIKLLGLIKKKFWAWNALNLK